MLKDIKNILLYNSGGGLGDSLLMIPLMQWLKEFYKLSKIYYIQNGKNKHFNSSLNEFKEPAVETLDFLPENFAFFKLNRINSYSNFNLSKTIIKKIGINKFDLIIDTQTRINNSLIIRSIPHKYFISPAAKFILSNPKKLILDSKHITGRIFNYLEKVLKKNILIPFELKNMDKKYSDEVSNLFDKDKKYIGFSITAGHPTRKKEIPIETIIKVANYFDKKNLVPTFLVEEKYKSLITKIKDGVKNSFFPEHKANDSLKNPFLVIAIGKKLQSAISIDNGILHMLALAGTKIAVFFNENQSSEKFRPLNLPKTKIYSASKHKKLDHLEPNDIINFVSDFF